MADEWGIGSAFGAVLGYMGQQETNEMNRELTMSGRDFNSGEAVANRNWQESMSNTAYQRATADMIKAGLNPMLAYHQGGASTPSGGQGQAPAAIPMGNKMAAAAQSAGTVAQIDNVKTNTAKQAAETDVANATAAEIRERTPTHSQSIQVMQQSIKQSQQEILKMIQEINTGVATESNLRQQTTNLQEMIPQIQETVKHIKAQIGLTGAQTKLTGAQTGLAVAHTAQANAQTQLTGAQTGEVNQRVRQDLPALEAALGNLERVQRDMALAGHNLNESFNSSATGTVVHALERVIKALNPFSGIIANVPNTPSPAQHGRKDWKK